MHNFNVTNFGKISDDEFVDSNRRRSKICKLLCIRGGFEIYSVFHSNRKDQKNNTVKTHKRVWPLLENNTRVSTLEFHIYMPMSISYITLRES